MTVGEQATFYCNHSATSSIAWRVNQTSLSRLNLETITGKTIRYSGGGFVHELTILALAEYNQTTVECVAYIADRSLPEYTARAILLIQGKVKLIAQSMVSPSGHAVI